MIYVCVCVCVCEKARPKHASNGLGQHIDSIQKAKKRHKKYMEAKSFVNNVLIEKLLQKYGQSTAQRNRAEECVAECARLAVTL